MTLGELLRGLVLGVLWLGVAGFGLCGMFALALDDSTRDKWPMLGMAWGGFAVLMGLIWLVRWLTAPAKPDDDAGDPT